MVEISWREAVDRYKDFVVFGQDDYASRVKSYLEKLGDDVHICEVSLELEVDRPDGTSFDFSLAKSRLENIERKDRPIFISFSAKYCNSASQIAVKAGFVSQVLYNIQVDNEMKKEFFKRKAKESGDSFQLLEDCQSDKFLKIYVARSIYDKAIKNSPSLTIWEEEVQGGASLTKKRICGSIDCAGENISDRNKRYCEMTVAYWIWKHSPCKYIGLCHYRRRFRDPDKIYEKLISNEIDAVLPLPTLARESVQKDYLEKHIPDIYPVMLDVLKNIHPADYEVSREIFQDNVFYASNMWILRHEVLDDFMNWMFPMLFEIESRVKDKYGLDGDLPFREDGQTDYYNRYAGFCAERLETLYFISRAKKLNIYHAEKIFIGDSSFEGNAAILSHI